MGPFKRAKKLREFQKEWEKLSKQTAQFIPSQQEKTIIKDKRTHQEVRRDLWCSVAVAFTGASNSTSKSGATNWADHVLHEFDKKHFDR